MCLTLLLRYFTFAIHFKYLLKAAVLDPIISNQSGHCFIMSLNSRFLFRVKQFYCFVICISAIPLLILTSNCLNSIEAIARQN